MTPSREYRKEYSSIRPEMVLEKLDGMLFYLVVKRMECKRGSPGPRSIKVKLVKTKGKEELLEVVRRITGRFRFGTGFSSDARQDRRQQKDIFNKKGTISLGFYTQQHILEK